MTKNHWGEIVLTKDEYKLLEGILAEHGVNLNWASYDGTEFSCYIRNPWKEAGMLWGNDLVKEQAGEFFDRYNRF